MPEFEAELHPNGVRSGRQRPGLAYSSAMALVYLNGELVPPEQARISVFDHGLVVGDGVFEMVLVRDGGPFLLERHLDRLLRSAGGLGIGVPARAEVESAVERVLASSTEPNLIARLRITWTAGPGPLATARDKGPGSLVVALETVPEAAPTSAVAIAPWVRNERGALAGLKTISYAENARALAWASARGADEAVFANTRGQLCEGTGSNVFVVVGGQISTPPSSSGCLAGVTRDLLLEVAGAKELDLPITAFNPDGLEEAFLTSAVRGVQPIATIDGRAFARVPGRVTSQIAQRFADLVRSLAAGDR